MPRPRLALVDAMSVSRARYETLPDDVAKDEQQSAAIADACAQSIRKQIREVAATHALVLSDVPDSKNWRHAVYSAYKSTRKPTPPPLALAVPQIRSILTEAGLHSAAQVGFEGEDLISSVVRIVRTRNIPIDIVIISRDKDVLALIGPGVTVYNHSTKQRFDEKAVKDKHGVSPEQLRSLLALKGDPVDSIPGGKGVGPVTAFRLLASYPDVPTMLADADNIPGKDGDLVRKSKDAIAVSWELVGMKDDCTIGLTLRELELAHIAHKEAPYADD